MFLEISAKPLKTICEEVLSNNATASRPANNNEFLQRNFSEIKFQLSYYENKFWNTLYWLHLNLIVRWSQSDIEWSSLITAFFKKFET